MRSIIASMSLTRKFSSSFILSRRSYARSRFWKVDVKLAAALKVDSSLANIGLVHPRLEDELARRQVFQPVTAAQVRFLKIRGFKNENCAPHPVVNFTMHTDDTGLIENHGCGFFVFAVTAEVESFGFRVRE